MERTSDSRVRKGILKDGNKKKPAKMGSTVVTAVLSAGGGFAAEETAKTEETAPETVPEEPAPEETEKITETTETAEV